MADTRVAIVRYDGTDKSVRRAVDLCGGLARLPAGVRVFVKPNVVYWTDAAPFPKWGVITTSRVVEDMVRILKERGIDDIVIGEGPVVADPKDRETPHKAFAALGYQALARRYGVKVISIFDRPFESVDLGDDIRLNVNADILESDFVVNLPVLKTHAQTVVSLGIKNLKGMIDVRSRKKCHNAESGRDLNHMVARLVDPMPPMFTLIDGIYSNERGPWFDGRPRRTDLLIASDDPLAADIVGATVLGYEPAQVPHLVLAAANRGRPSNLSWLRIVGEPIEDVVSFHEYAFPYTEDGALPAPMAKMGVEGLSYRKYDLTLCTYCAGINGAVLAAIAAAWSGKPWDDVEILTGKEMAPTPGKNKTVLLGQCMYKAHRSNPDIRERIVVKGCPPKPADILAALRQVGIEVDPAFFDNLDRYPARFMARYKDRPEFDESFFRVQ
ncbi:MAG: DUF362 domain-containing protein [Desulfobacterales bacterium]|nr:DUF362 domain-containing protein [Desulfobacterales bacterium]